MSKKSKKFRNISLIVIAALTATAIVACGIIRMNLEEAAQQKFDTYGAFAIVVADIVLVALTFIIYGALVAADKKKIAAAEKARLAHLASCWIANYEQIHKELKEIFPKKKVDKWKEYPDGISLFKIGVSCPLCEGLLKTNVCYSYDTKGTEYRYAGTVTTDRGVRDLVVEEEVVKSTDEIRTEECPNCNMTFGKYQIRLNQDGTREITTMACDDFWRADVNRAWLKKFTKKYGAEFAGTILPSMQKEY